MHNPEQNHQPIIARREFLAAAVIDKNDFGISRGYRLQVLDRLGAGDSFAGALLSSLMEKKSAESCAQFAAAACCLKHSIFGDFNKVSRSDVEALATGSENVGRVKR